MKMTREEFDSAMTALNGQQEDEEYNCDCDRISVLTDYVDSLEEENKRLNSMVNRSHFAFCVASQCPNRTNRECHKTCYRLKEFKLMLEESV